MPNTGTKSGLNGYGRLLTGITIIAWIGLFAAGIIVNSEPYRNQITGQGPGAGLENMILVWVIVLLCYTPTNIAALSLASGLMGALGRKATLHCEPEEGEETTFPDDPINPYLSGLIRGFFMYLVIISGTVIVLETPFSAPSQEQYIRLAGIISIASFIISYNPQNFASFFQKAYDAITRKKREGDQPQI